MSGSTCACPRCRVRLPWCRRRCVRPHGMRATPGECSSSIRLSSRCHEISWGSFRLCQSCRFRTLMLPAEAFWEATEPASTQWQPQNLPGEKRAGPETHGQFQGYLRPPRSVLERPNGSMDQDPKPPNISNYFPVHYF